MSNHQKAGQILAAVQLLVREDRLHFPASTGGGFPLSVDVASGGQMVFADLLTDAEQPDPFRAGLLDGESARVVARALREVRKLTDSSEPELTHLRILLDQLLGCRLWTWTAGRATRERVYSPEENTCLPTGPARLSQDGPSADLLADLVESAKDTASRIRSAPQAGTLIASACHSEARHSIDFHSVMWFGTKYEFSSTQAACVKVLWEAWEAGTPTVGGQMVLDEAGSDGGKLAYVFKDHSAWKTMIVQGEKKGNYRLKSPLNC